MTVLMHGMPGAARESSGVPGNQGAGSGSLSRKIGAAVAAGSDAAGVMPGGQMAADAERRQADPQGEAERGRCP
jgi:hypothetical protein